MTPIQVLLLSLIFGGLWIYLQFFRSRSRDRAFVAAIFLGSGFLVMMPNVASRLASLLHVGRGVDLVMYLAILLLGYFNLIMYSRHRHLQHQLDRLARHAAIYEAEQNAATPKRSGRDDAESK